MIQVDRILTNATVITMSAQWQIFSPGAIAITGSDIIAVGPAAQISTAITLRRLKTLPAEQSSRAS